MANLGRQNNFLLLTSEEWVWIRDEILKDERYSDMTISDIEAAIVEGVKGRYDRDKFQVNINSITIFRWLDRFKGDKYLKNLMYGNK